jgi:hypothetical protein
VEIDQVYKAPSIPKINRRNIKSTLISGAIKPGVELKRTKFSFIKPLAKLIPESLIPDKTDENKKEGLVKYIQSNFGIQKVLEQSNKLLSQIKEQLSLDFLSRIKEEKKDLEEAKKKIAAEKVKDKENKLESGFKGFLGKTFNTILAPAKSIFQKLIDFFSIIFTGILINNAFRWLQKPENQEKLKQFFQFLKDYWKELLIVFGAIKLLGLVRKILKVANALKGLIDFFRSKPKLPCNCPKSPAQNVDDCLPLKDCIDSLVRNPRRSGPMLEALASLIIATNAFEPVRKLLNQKGLPIPPVPAPAAAPPPPQAATPVTATQAVQQNQATPSPQLAASTAVKQQNIPKNLQTVVQNLVTQYYQSGYKQQRTTTKQGDIIIVEATNSTGVFSKRDYNPKVVFQPGRATQQQNATQGFEGLLGLFALVNALPGGRLRGRTGLPQSSRSFPKPKLTPEPTEPTVKPQRTVNVIPEQTVSEPTTKTIRPQKKLNPEVVNKTLIRRKIENNLNKSQDQDIVKAERSFYANASDDELLTLLKSRNKITRNVAAEQLLKRGVNLPTDIRDTITSGLSFNKGGTIPALFAGGGTVGGPGSLGIDSVPAMIASGAKQLGNYGKALLAPGEEVIPTRPSMLFRPLLKDISENAGRLWQSFANAVKRQDTVNAMKSDIIFEFNKVLEEFKNLLDKESNEIKRKNRSARRPPGGGGIRPTLGSGGKSSNTPVLSNTQSLPQNAQPMKMPKVDMPADSSKIAPQPQQKITPPQISTIEPKVIVNNPIDITQKIIQRPTKGFSEKPFVDNTKLYVIPVKETISGTSKYQVSKQKPSINYITLPTKTMNLGSTGSKPLSPSSPSGTSVPSISPIDESNDYVFMTPSMYGIVVV